MFIKKLLLCVTLLALYFAMSSTMAVAGPAVPHYAWHTYYGTETVVHAVAVDGAHNVYAAGESLTTWTGDGGAAPLNPFAAHDLVILKLDASGAYQWHTYYGSLMTDAAWGIATDAENNVYVTGYSAGRWHGPNGELPLHDPGFYNPNLFVLKLNSDGAYQWHTFYGPTYYPTGARIAVGKGRVAVTGLSGESWLGDGDAAPLHPHGGGLVNGNAFTDMLILQLDTAGAYRWHTFYGAADANDHASAIAMDKDGNLFVTGGSDVSWQGNNSTNALHAFSGSGDMVTLKLARNGSYQWHTFYGSDVGETGTGVALDKAGYVYIGGSSTKSWQGAANVSPLHAFTGDSDLYALKLDMNGMYQWHTFYGSGGMDESTALATDGTNVYLAGRSPATWQGDGSANPLHAFAGDDNVVVLELSGRGSYRWHTFYGPSNQANTITTDGPKNIYVGAAGSKEMKGEQGQEPLRAPAADSNLIVLKLAVFEAPTQAPVLVNPKDNATVQKLAPKLVWKEVPTAANYELKLRQSTGKKKMVSEVTVSGLEFHTPVLVNKHTYEWRVRACNVYGCGDWSPWWTFQVLVR